MKAPSLRPPLLPPLSHDGISFRLDTGVAGEAILSPHFIAAIASSLQALLPEGDLQVNQYGEVSSLTSAVKTTHAYSLWHQAGLLAGVDRSLP